MCRDYMCRADMCCAELTCAVQGLFGTFVHGDLAVRPYGDLPVATDRYGSGAEAEAGGESRRQKKQKEWKKKRGAPRPVAGGQCRATVCGVRTLLSCSLWYEGTVFGVRQLPSHNRVLREHTTSIL